MEKEKKEFFYYVRFYYNGKNYSFLLTSHTELEKEESVRCLIDTVEFGIRDYLAAEDLLVEGKVLQNVCLYDENGKFIVCTSDLVCE